MVTGRGGSRRGTSEALPAGDDAGPGDLHRAAGDPVARLADVLDRVPALLPRGSSVLVALSGGSDSVALLHLLHELAVPRRWTLTAAHFDHGLRPESGAEADRVRGWSEGLGIECRLGRAAGLEGGQAAYRRARYRFLRAEAVRVGADRIALAHQRDDQVETLLHRLGRGTGLRGLGGVPAGRGPFARPLLGFGRVELRRFLTERDAEWLEDPTNRDLGYARARLRLVGLPRLRAAGGPGIDELLLRLARDARVVETVLEERAGRAAAACRLDGEGGEKGGIAAPGGPGVQIARSRLAAYDRAEQARILRILARNQGCELTRGGTRLGIEFIRRGASGTGVDLGRKLRLGREYDRFTLGPPAEVPEDEELVIPGPEAGSGRVRLGGRTFRVRWWREKEDSTAGESVAGIGRGEESATGTPVDAVGENGPEAARFALRALDFPLRVRGPRPGDRIRGPAGTRKLKKLLNERRVPRSRRSSVPVLVMADGRVVWVAGHAIGRAVAENDGNAEKLRVEVVEVRRR